MNQISSEEKLDYIYERLKKQEKTEKLHLFLKWGFRVIIVGYLYYFLTIGLPALIGNLIPSMPSIGSGESNTNIEELKGIVEDYFAK